MLLTARRLASRLLRVAVFAVLAVWFLVLRPTALGGSTTYVFVGGESMVPTYAVGDLIVAQPAPEYGAGMIVVYRIPDGAPGAGRLVIHRIVGGDAESGFTTQGDHNGYTDRWHPRTADILGTPTAVLTGVGTLIQVLRAPLVAATIAALLVMSALWPGRRTATGAAPTSVEARLARLRGAPGPSAPALGPPA